MMNFIITEERQDETGRIKGYLHFNTEHSSDQSNDSPSQYIVRYPKEVC